MSVVLTTKDSLRAAPKTRFSWRGPSPMSWQVSMSSSRGWGAGWPATHTMWCLPSRPRPGSPASATPKGATLQARLIDQCCWACRHVGATQPASCSAHASGKLGGDQRTARLPRLRRAVLVRGAPVCVDGPDSKPDTYDHDHPEQQRGTGMPDSGGFLGAEDHLRRGQAPASPRVLVTHAV